MSVGRNWFSAGYSRTTAFQEKETVGSVVHSGMPGTHSRPVTSGTWEDEAGSGQPWNSLRSPARRSAASFRTKLPRAPPTAAPVSSLAYSPPAIREWGSALSSSGWSNRNDGKDCHWPSGFKMGGARQRGGAGGRRGVRRRVVRDARSRDPAREPVLSPRPPRGFSPVNCRPGRFRSAGRHAGTLQGETRGSAAGGGDPTRWVRGASLGGTEPPGWNLCGAEDAWSRGPA